MRSNLIYIGIVGLLILLYIKRKTVFEIAETILKKFESFSSKPYWDFKQWSWGYGTRVPDSSYTKDIQPAGTIDKQRASVNMMNVVRDNYNTLSKQISVKLTDNQWAALLSFSYNAGIGAAQKLINEINHNLPSLQSHWKQYIYAGGNVNPTLVSRRNDEWKLYTT